jgi:alpha-mannosidase
LSAGAFADEHEALLRCYVPFAQPFGGLRLLLRDEAIFRLAVAMRTLLEAVETYRDSDPAYHVLLARLNEAHNLLDLREGWQSERFAESARAALTHLQVSRLAGFEATTDEISEGGANLPTSQPANLPTIVATGHAHLDVAWLWPLWRTRQKWSCLGSCGRFRSYRG